MIVAAEYLSYSRSLVGKVLVLHPIYFCVYLSEFVSIV